MTKPVNNLKHYKEMTKGELIHALVLRDKKIMEAENRRVRNAANLRRLATVIFDSNDAITVQDLDGTIKAWNKGAELIYGYSEVEALGMNISDIVPDKFREEALDLMRQIKTGRPLDSIETQRVTKDGRILDVWLTLTKLRDEQGNVIAVATTERDITERKQMEHDLRMASITDDMTGLYNRRGLKLFADKVLSQSERTNNSVLLFYFDLDNLKVINDTFGHREGDRSIIDFSEILKSTFRKSDIVARIGGDEFAALVTGLNRPGTEHIIIEKIREKICKYNENEWLSHMLDVSIGVSCFNAAEPCDIDDLLSQADNAMYNEKKEKKDIKKNCSLHKKNLFRQSKVALAFEIL